MWGIVIAVVLAIAWIALRANYEYRQLEAGSCRINALIEKVEQRHHDEQMQK